MVWPTAVPTFTAGQRLKASALTSLAATVTEMQQAEVTATKTATESVTSSTTLQDDNELFCSIAANAVCKLEMVLLYDGNTSGDIKIAFTQPTGCTMSFGVYGPATAFDGTATAREIEMVALVGQTSSPTSSLSYGVLTSAVDGIILVKGTVTNGANAGTIRLQWAQNASNGTATNVYAGSYLTLRRRS